MRVLVFIVSLLAALYAAYWFVGRAAVERGALRAIAAAEAEGWRVEYAALSTRGFPSRFDTTVTDLRLTSPDGAVTVEAPFVQVLALSYRPNRAILVAPPRFAVTGGGRRVEVAADGLRASLALGLSPSLPLRSLVVEARSLAAEGTTLGPLVGAVRAEAAETAYDVYLSTGPVAVEGRGPVLDSLVVDGVATLDRPLDRSLRGAPGLRGLRIAQARAARGPALVAATAELAPDAACRLAGTAEVTLEGWEELLDLGEEAGVLDAGRRALAERGLGLLALGQERLTLPVALAEGRVSALGLPLLDAPRVCAP